MTDIIKNSTIFLLSHFTLTCFVLGLITACIALLFKAAPRNKALVVDVFFSHFLFFSIGISYLYGGFIMHVFFGTMTAQFIGWAPSPFQTELGFASLGMAVNGIIACWLSRSGFRAATIIAPAIFFWGAAGGHLYQMIMDNNFSPGNAGIIFWTDIFIPIIGFIFLGLQCACRQKT